MITKQQIKPSSTATRYSSLLKLYKDSEVIDNNFLVTLKQLPLEDIIALKLEASFKDNFHFRLIERDFSSLIERIATEAYYLFLASTYKTVENVARVTNKSQPQILQKFFLYNVEYKLRSGLFSRKFYQEQGEDIYCDDFSKKQFKKMVTYMNTLKDRKKNFSNPTTKETFKMLTRMLMTQKDFHKIVKDHEQVLDASEHNVYAFLQLARDSSLLNEENLKSLPKDMFYNKKSFIDEMNFKKIEAKKSKMIKRRRTFRKKKVEMESDT